MTTAKSEWLWTVATGAEAVHALLEASDRRSAAGPEEIPHRSATRTAHLVASGAVQLLSIGGRAAAMITLVNEPPFDPEGILFSDVERPLYMQRLAVDEWAVVRFGALPGIATLRRALEVGRQRGADALRSEINPDLIAVRRMLLSFGFREVGQREGRLMRAYVEYRLA